MKYSLKFIIIIVAIWVFILFHQNVQAQQNLAQEAYAIFEQSCLICHGQNGSYRESLTIEHKALINDGKVIPEDPDGSVFYQRLIETNPAKRMPLGQPPLAPEAIETIRQWILAGAPDWNAISKPETDFITTDTVLQTIENHVNSLSARDKSFARYFTLTHLYNADETTEALNAYRRALSKLINSLSWGREVVKPQPIDAEQTIFYIDLRDYEWDVRNDAWTQIEQAYPYKMPFDAPTQTQLREKLTTLQQEMNCEVPFVHVDWFLANASLPPLYHDILALPETDRELEASLEVFVAENLQNAPGKRVWRAGFNDSGVSQHNRVVERHISRYGAYWKSYDFAGSADEQNIFTHPLDFSQDGGEIIFNLPNGLQAYLIVDRDGIRIDAAPISIVRNPATSDPTVRNGLSCIGCHTEGMKTFEDKVRATVEKATNPPYDKVKALDLYVQKTVMDALVAEDTQRFRVALEKTGGVFGGIEPVQRFHETFQGTLSAAHAAAAVGLQTQDFVQKILRNERLQSLGLLVLTDENGNIKRDAWTSNFHGVISALNSLDSVLPPVEQRPEVIPGAGVYIPDVNLRTAIEEALDKAVDDVITAEEMAMVGYVRLRGKNLRNLKGIEYAINLDSFIVSMTEAEAVESTLSDLSPLAGLTNLRHLHISGKMISDLSPLSGLLNLEKLQLFVTNVSDLSPLTGLSNLKSLTFNHAPVSDLSPLAGLTSLESLKFFYAESPSRRGLNPSLEPLKGLVGLKQLSAGRSKISDISPLAGLVNLEELELFGNQLISDVSPLASMHKLRRLNLHRNNISDVSPLASLRSLVWVDLAYNNISDISHMEGLPEDPNVIWYENPGFPVGGPKIEGPWLWSMVPGPELDNNTDFLAQASGGAVTELQIASYGATEGTFVGESVWTAHNISSTGDNNVSQMINALGWTTDEETVGYILYGSVKLNSPRKQQTEIFVGADDGVKVWLNGEFIHKRFGARWDPFANNYQNNIPVTLNEGVNVLLVAIDNRWGNWSGFFGFEPETEYTVLPPRIIADPNLRDAIAEALGREDSNSAPITLQEMATLTILRASNRDIKDLTGLEHAVNLEELWISKNPASDLSPLANLKKLTGLGAWETPISDLSPLANLPKLRWLDFGHTPTDGNRNLIGNLDLTPLANITSLKKLTFYACGIRDISPLANLTGLTHLAVGGNRDISDALPVAGLINLEHLDFHHDSISDLAPLAGLANLRHLNLYDNRLISDLSPLISLTELTELRLARNMISDVSPLAGLANLEKLTLSDNLISDVSPLKELINLKGLNLINNLIDDISALEGLTVNTYITWLKNPGAPIEGPKIEGPWLWMLVAGEHLENDTDLLAEVSGGSVTELEIATKGATEGEVVGDNKWTNHNISPTGRNNFQKVLRTFGVPPDQDTNDNVLYGCTILTTTKEQSIKMLVGTEGHNKIWLNGELIHHNLNHPKSVTNDDRINHDYAEFFPVMLKKGTNILLVAVDDAHWITGYFGFEEGTEYTVLPPDVRFTFSATETNLLTGDTFTLNLNAENISDLAGWQADITFDPNALEAVDITEGDFLKTDDAATFFQGGTIDNTAGKITSLYSARISEGGASGTGTLLSVTFKAKAGGETYVTLENFEFSSVTGDIIPAVPPNITITVGDYPPWDVNQDGRVSILDIVLVAQDLGSGAPANLRTDVNRDGVINIQDLVLVANHMGESTDSAAPAIENDELTPALVEKWIKQAHVEDDGSLAFRQGIENLERLLASLIPEKTALLANYPNPFNPETWIPYHLAKPAEVTVRIYAVNGTLIRSLALGHKHAGIYEHRNRAAYWDGRNAQGEHVASGIYFYTLTAGDFAATRKMLIRK